MFRLEDVTELLVSGQRTNCGRWQAGRCSKECSNCITLHFRIESILTQTHYQNDRTLIHSLLILFQHPRMTTLPKLTRNSININLNIRWRLQIMSRSFLQNLLDVKSTARWNNFTSRWCENNYSPVPQFAFSTPQITQFFFSSNSSEDFGAERYEETPLSVIRRKTSTV